MGGSDEEVDVNAIDDSGYELVLPSGAKVGHRSLMRYYKQSLNPDRQVALTSGHQRKPGQLSGVINKYKGLGWTGLTGVEAKKKAKDLKFMRKAQQKHYMKLGMNGNRLQKHFVDPTGHIG